MPLMEALARRQSQRDLAPTPVSEETLSSLLWAAAGINRPESGKRTAPSARNWQGIDVYVARADGLFLYEPREHRLRRVLKEDVREAAGKQPFVAQAPIVLIYVADASRMPDASADAVAFYSATDTGFISQNVYLFCAANRLATVVIGWLDKEALARRIGLPENRRVVLSQAIGHPAKEPAPEPDAKPAAVAKEAPRWRDGAYRGSARGYVDDIVVEVVVRDGLVRNVTVVEHKESRPLRALRDLPRRIAMAQGTDGVDAVTGATVTSDALLEAVRQALAKAAP